MLGERLFVLLALASADNSKGDKGGKSRPAGAVDCQSGQDNDLDYAACSDYCAEARHCSKWLYSIQM